MRYATLMEKGNPSLADVASKTKDEMQEFVSYYRRFSVRYFMLSYYDILSNLALENSIVNYIIMI